MEAEDKLKKIHVKGYQLEGIFYITLVISVIHAGFILWDLFTLLPGTEKVIHFIRPNTITATSLMSNLYLTLLGVYAGYKEFSRWTLRSIQIEDKLKKARRGEVIVICWVIITVTAIVLLQLHLIERLPEELFRTVLQVLGVFFGSAASKSLFSNSLKDADKIKNMNEYQSSIRDYIKQNGSITPKECRDMLGLSRMTAYRIIRDMLLKGTLQARGKTNQKQYVLK